MGGDLGEVVEMESRHPGGEAAAGQPGAGSGGGGGGGGSGGGRPMVCVCHGLRGATLDLSVRPQMLGLEWAD